MFNWNDQDQAGVLLWGKHKKNEDHIVPRPRKIEGNNLPTFGEYSKKQSDEDASNTTRSTMETSGAKHDFFCCNVEKRSSNASQDCNNLRLHMDAWPDFPYLSSAVNDWFNDGSDHDLAVTELMIDLADASNLYSGGGSMTSYNNSSVLLPNKGLSSLSKPCSLLTGDAMQLDGEPELFGHDDKGNDSFLDYDWANMEEFDDLDKIFRNNDSFDRNEEVHNAYAFHNTSADITSFSQPIPVPGLPTSMEQTSDNDSPHHQLGEHSDAKVNSLLAKKSDGQSQTLRTKEEEKGKGLSFEGLNYSQSSESQTMSSAEVQGSNVNPVHIIQSPPLGQLSSSHGVIFADYGYPTPLPQECVESKQHKPIHGGIKANLNRSNNHKSSNKAEETVRKPTIMTPQQKIKKLRRRQQMQAMLAIQKQREQYGHQISSTDDSVSQAFSRKNQTQDATTSTDAMEEYKHKQSGPEVSCLEEHDQSQVVSSSINGRSVEEAIYHQLQYAMQKLDVRVRLSIRDSLFRLARSAMDRQNASDRSSVNKNEEDEIFVDEESNNHDRSSRMPDSETDTNPIDRIVAHLLFHNSSGS